MKSTPKLIQLFQQMSDLTAPECASVCKVPHSCCDSMYCDMAEEIALAQHVVLVRTGHATLQFMGPTGCTVPPHFRPLCTLHTCEVSAFGFKAKDLDWTKQYFKIREAIEQEEWANAETAD